jgi:WD40 repeat protein
VLHVDIGEHESYFYYVMDLADDQESGRKITPDTYTPRTLRSDLQSQRRLAASVCVKLGQDLAKALAALHEAGLLHRDIKPANIIFVNGAPKLADIGLVADENEARSWVGTEGFVAPEGPNSKQGDVFSLGKVLYEASTGMDRMEYPDWPVSVAEVAEREVFLELNEVIVRACESDLGKRYATADAMGADLDALDQGKSLRHRRLRKERFWRIVQVAGACALLTAAVCGIHWQRREIADTYRRLVQASVVSGIEAVDSGDWLGALPHFTEALRFEPTDALTNRDQRLRLGAILDLSPKLTRVWFGPTPANDGQFSPDGARVLLARYYGNAEVYDVSSGHMQLSVLKAPRTLLNAAYSPDGRQLVTVSQNSVACIWDAATFKQVRRLPHPSEMWGARFSPDGRRLVTAASDGVARVWEIQTAQLVLTLRQHTEAVHFAEFSHDGKRIVTASHDGTAQLWDATNGQPAGGPLQHGAWVTYAAFSPDDQKLVTACADRRARVWETATGQRLPPDLDHRDGVQGAEFSPDGRFILTASADGSARLWLAENRQPVPGNSILRHPGRLTRACFSPDGHRILTTGTDGSARLWELAGSQGKAMGAGGSLSADGSRFLTVSNESVQVWEATSDDAGCQRLTPRSKLQRAVLGPDGRFVVSCSTVESQGTNQEIQVWDADAGKAVGPAILLSSPAASVALAERGQTIVISEGDHVRSWDAVTGSPLSPPVAVTEPASHSLFSHDGNRVATLSGREVRVWDAHNGRAVFVPLTLPQPIQDAQFSPNDRYLAIGCSENGSTAAAAQVFDAANGQPVGPKLEHKAGILSVAFSPDSRRVVTASADFTAVVWDFATGRQVAGPLKHEDQVRRAAFSPDGRWIVTASADKTARVWDAASGTALTPPLRSPGPLAQAGFLAGQSRVVTIEEAQGSVRLWRLTIEQRPLSALQSLACWLSGDTTPAEARPPSGSVEAIGQRFDTNCPSAFAVSAQDIANWHEFQARDSERQAQWFAAAFHLQRLLALRPDDLSLPQRLTHAKEYLH